MMRPSTMRPLSIMTVSCANAAGSAHERSLLGRLGLFAGGDGAIGRITPVAP